MATLEEKARISFGSAVLFGLVNLPGVYKITDKFLPGRLQLFGCPTAWGQLIHTFIFGLLSFLSMGDLGEETAIKIKHSFYGAMIFFFLTSPFIYSLVGGVFGTSNNAGCPNLWGVILHSLVYFLVLLGVMSLAPVADRLKRVRDVAQMFKGK